MEEIMNKRATRKLTDVISDVKAELAINFKIDDQQIAKFRNRVDINGHQFPTGSTMVEIDNIWIDYEVQRDVIVKHIIAILKKYDPRLCGPVSACRILKSTTVDCMHIFAYDGQHRTIATAILGYDAIPCNIVETDDPAFPSYAFEELNESGVKKLSQGDLHRNALTRYKLGSTEEKNCKAKTVQDKFDKNSIDLEDKTTRRSAKLRGNNDYFFAHFIYAYKGIDLDRSGNTLNSILNAITTVYTHDEEVNQDLYIGLYELSRLDSQQQLPAGWMLEVLETIAKTFNRSSSVNGSLFSEKAKLQVNYISPGRTWSAPNIMANFIRELYMINGGKLNLPYHGAGAVLQLAENPAPGLFPRKAA
jgi:hypothetical protein